MSRPERRAIRFLAALLVSAGIAACSGEEVPAPLIWRERHVVVMPVEGGRQIQSLWVRNGISLIARYRSAARVDADDLLLDVDRRLVWLRDGAELKALTLPALELCASLALPADAGSPPLGLADDGAVIVGDERFRWADDSGGQRLAPPLRVVQRARPRN